MEINESIIIIIIIINLYHTCRPRKANVDTLFSASVKKKKTRWRRKLIVKGTGSR